MRRRRLRPRSLAIHRQPSMFLIDHNLSHKLVVNLADKYPGCKHVFLENLSTEDDIVIRKFAHRHQLSILTKDADFYELHNLYGFPPKIIWLRVGNVTTREIIQFMESNEEVIKNFLSDPQKGLLEIYP